MVSVINQASAPPPEIGLIEDLVDAPDDVERRKLLETNSEQITPEFIDAITNIVSQVDNSGDKELADRIKAVHRLVVRYSMENQLRK